MRAFLALTLLLTTGCLALPADDDELSASTSPRLAGDAGPYVVTLKGEAQMIAAVGAPCVSNVRPCSRGPIQPGTLEVEQAGAQIGRFVAAWSATTPAAERARIEIRDDQGVSAGSIEGSSPLRLDLGPESLRPGTLTVFFEPATASVGVDEKASFVLTLHYG